MASRYVPPHLRHKSKDATENTSPGSTGDHVAMQLARRRLSDLKISTADERPRYTLDELNHHFKSTIQQSTLRDSSSRPGQLAFVVLFYNANPRWNSDHIIFAHTNIHLLPGFKEEYQQQSGQDTADRNEAAERVSDFAGCKGVDRDKKVKPDSTTDIPPQNIVASNQSTPAPFSASSMQSDAQSKTVSIDLVPVFMELAKHHGPRKFGFHGYFRLLRVEFLKPNSPELVRMLQQKWEPVQRNPNRPPGKTRQRDHDAWAKSLRQEWAVLQFNTVPKDEVPEAPQIEILPEGEKHSDSVLEEKSANVPTVEHNVEQVNSVEKKTSSIE